MAAMKARHWTLSITRTQRVQGRRSTPPPGCLRSHTSHPLRPQLITLCFSKHGLWVSDNQSLAHFVWATDVPDKHLSAGMSISQSQFSILNSDTSILMLAVVWYARLCLYLTLSPTLPEKPIPISGPESPNRRHTALHGHLQLGNLSPSKSPDLPLHQINPYILCQGWECNDALPGMIMLLINCLMGPGWLMFIWAMLVSLCCLSTVLWLHVDKSDLRRGW